MHDPQDDHRGHWRLVAAADESILPAIEATLLPEHLFADFRPGYGILIDRRLAIYRRPLGEDVAILAIVVDSPMTGEFRAVTAFPVLTVAGSPVAVTVTTVRDWLTAVEGRLDLFLEPPPDPADDAGTDSVTAFAGDFFANRPWYAANMVRSVELAGFISRARPATAEMLEGASVGVLADLERQQVPPDEVRLVGTIRTTRPVALVDGPGVRLDLVVRGLGQVPLVGLVRGHEDQLAVGDTVAVDAWLQCVASGPSWKSDRMPRVPGPPPDLTADPAPAPLSLASRAP